MSTNVMPYGFFYGRCAEALAFYKGEWMVSKMSCQPEPLEA